MSLALSHQRVAVKRRGRQGPSRPSAGGAGRAEGASLDGRRLVRQRLAKRDAGHRSDQIARTLSWDRYRRHIAMTS